MATKIKLGPLKMADYGYKGVAGMTKVARHRALLKILREKKGETPLALFRRLNVLMIYTKFKAPKSSKAFKEDRDWLAKKFKLSTQS